MMRASKQKLSPLKIPVVVLVLLIAAIAGCAATETQETKRITAAKWREDIDALRSAIVNRHPRFADESMSFSLRDAFENAAEAVREPMDRAEGFRVLGLLNPFFEDAHTVLLPLPEEAAALREEPGRLFPFTVNVRGGRILVDGTMIREADGVVMPDGAEITSINGIETDRLLTQLERYGHGETGVLRQHMLRVMFEDWLFAVMGWQDQFTVVLAGDAGASRVVIARRGDRWTPAQDDERTEEPRVQFIQSDVAYLRLPTFDVDEAPEIFERAVDDAFEEIRERGATRLILDVRGNTGGQSDAGAAVLRYLVDRPVVQVASARERLHEDNNGVLGYKGSPGEVVEMSLDGKDQIIPVENGRRFSGRVVALVDSMTYSAGILFATSVRDHRIGTIVGQPTGGFANQTGNMEPFHLPNSGLTIYIPARIFVRPSGDTRLMPLIPDVVVDSVATFDESDAVIAAAIKVLNGEDSASANAVPEPVQEAFRRIESEAHTEEMADRFRALWGVEGRVPVVLHDEALGAWATEEDGGSPRQVVLREDQLAANTCLDSETNPRVMLTLPLPEGQDALAKLVWHERWHCAQPKLGFTSREANTAHLATEAGRMWLRLELRALISALDAADERGSREAALAALAFRAKRSGAGRLGVGELAEEARLERNEGLAEYTGQKVASTDLVLGVVEVLREADVADSFVRSAAYSTGPAYGLLLDRWAPDWRQKRGDSVDLSMMLATAIDANTSMPDADVSGAAFGMADIQAEERIRAIEHQKAYEANQARYAGLSAMRLPLFTPSISFDPRSLFPLGDHGTIYSPITVRDTWGRLVADDGALLANDWSSISVSADGVVEESGKWRGRGWSLELSDSWYLAKEKNGSWQLKQLESN